MSRRVRLKADPIEGWSSETGRIMSIDKESSTVVVILDDSCRQDEDDDGMREVDIDQIEEFI